MTTNTLILAGTMLSNICYNMKQDENLPLHVRQNMEECVKAWDEALTSHRSNAKKVAMWKKENM